MARRIGAAQAKAHLSDLMVRVARTGEPFLIERRGKPVAALVSVDDLERLEQGCSLSDRPAV
jgi:prevent-host-death family protein